MLLIDVEATVDAFERMARGLRYQSKVKEATDYTIAVKLIRESDLSKVVEAEPVVRCKDCVCSSMLGNTLICERISNVMDGYYHGTVDVVKPDDFCSYGVRQKAKAILDEGE